MYPIFPLVNSAGTDNLRVSSSPGSRLISGVQNCACICRINRSCSDNRILVKNNAGLDIRRVSSFCSCDDLGESCAGGLRRTSTFRGCETECAIFLSGDAFSIGKRELPEHSSS